MPRAGVIDAHIHGYPPEVASDPAGWGTAHGEPGWTACVAPQGRRSIQGWADLGRLLADMDRAGVACCVLLGWYWERQETCDLQNRWYLQWIKAHPDRLLGFAAVQPAAGKVALEHLERALDDGLCGVGELLPQATGATLEEEAWRRMIERVVARGLPLTFHATDPAAGPAAGPKTPLGDFIRLARDFPTGRFILAHWGGGLACREAEPGAGALPPNLYFDTAASPLLYGSDVFRQAAERVGAGRILYGSDYPLLLHPSQSREPGFDRFLGEVERSGLDAAQLRQVLGGNVRALLAPGLAPGAKGV